MSFLSPTLRRITKAVVATSLLAALAACGDPKYQPPAIVVTFDPDFPPPTTINTGAIAGIAADVANDSKTAGVTFSCTPTSACGSFTPPTVASAAPTCYQAPEAIPTGGTVTVTATSVTDPTKSISAMITVITGEGSTCQ
jgi:predicted small lipoprotein YifL